jgi:hypothetical protein
MRDSMIAIREGFAIRIESRLLSYPESLLGKVRMDEELRARDPELRDEGRTTSTIRVGILLPYTHPGDTLDATEARPIPPRFLFGRLFRVDRHG